MKPTNTSDLVYLKHIRKCVKLILEYTGGDKQTFLDSRLVQDAVIRNLQTLAESTQRLSDSLKATEPGIQWRQIAGFRNMLVHAYLGLDIEAVWQVIERDLEDLSKAVERMTLFIGGDTSS